MSGLAQHSPLAIARESMAMSRQSGSPAFQTVAMVLMGVMATAAVVQAAHLILRDLRQAEGPVKLLPALNEQHGRGR